MLYYNNVLVAPYKLVSEVSGVKKSYKAWCISASHLYSGELKGDTLICVATVLKIIDGDFKREYVYIGYHENLETLLSVDLSNYIVKDFYYIPVHNISSEDIENIIEDIKLKNQDNDIAMI